MKISLNWLSDHIVGGIKKIEITELVERFIQTTAEIEGWTKVSLNCNQLTLAKIIEINSHQIVLYSCELHKTFILPFRSNVAIDEWFLLKHQNNEVTWATIDSLGGTKDTLLPAICIDKLAACGAWKLSEEIVDYIIEIDNKSINHRPDLWGHRGIAREIAAMFDLSLISLKEMINENQCTVEHSDFVGKTGHFSVAIKTPDLCKQFSALHLSSIERQASSLDMVIRLSRLDRRSIDYIVDCTNYVMLDLGQPMHSFDADTLISRQISVRCAKNKEQITVLDGETLDLMADDIVIADGERPISLAGIMGGISTGVSAQTKSVLLEAAHFDPVAIRKTSARYKKRTEASMRFEKNLDPYHVSDAIVRYLFLLAQGGVKYQIDSNMVILGGSFTAATISVAHSFIEQRLGIKISSDTIINILTKLSFSVSTIADKDDTHYIIVPPLFRMTKDIAIAEDIVEEVGRYIGYDTICQVMPAVSKVPVDLSKTYTIRKIKRCLSTGLLMHELYNYSFFDESFVKKMGLELENCVSIKNPISENYTRLVTTLQSHLLKAVEDNYVHNEALRFYEWGRIWKIENNVMIEKQSMSGCFFEHKKKFDFYDGKLLLNQLFDTLGMDIRWQPLKKDFFSWLCPYKTAQLVHNGVRIGCAGMVNVHSLNLLSVEGDLFIFELDGDYISRYKQPIKRFKPLAKYPSVMRDVSLLVPLESIVDDLVVFIKQIDMHIVSVVLVDFFSKPEWHDKKAMTFHVEMRDDEKTFDSHEIDLLWSKVIDELQKYGAIIR